MPIVLDLEAISLHLQELHTIHCGTYFVTNHLSDLKVRSVPQSTNEPHCQLEFDGKQN
jgi:hypothetical protein